MTERTRGIQRYFIHSLNQVSDLLFSIRNKREEMEVERPVFCVVVRESAHIKRLHWCLLEANISFRRESLGSGIAAFYVDMSAPYWVN